MKKVFGLEELDCANCAAKMEEAIKKIDGVTSASVSFMTQKLTIEADDGTFDEIMKKAVKACKKIEPDCRINYKAAVLCQKDKREMLSELVLCQEKVQVKRELFY